MTTIVLILWLPAAFLVSLFFGRAADLDSDAEPLPEAQYQPLHLPALPGSR